MTKLEELRAAEADAWAAAVDVRAAADVRTAEAAYVAARDAYWAELDKIQEENSND
jgi:hypothetical protein